MTTKHYILLLEIEDPNNDYYDILVDYLEKLHKERVK
jgi:hypothetical protein